MLRSLLFNLAFWVWTVAMAIALLPALAFPRQVLLMGVRAWMQGIQSLLRALVGLDYELRGLERVPNAPAIFAFKHQSAWETLSLHLLLPDPAIVLKRELALIPLFGQYTRRAGMIHVDRAQGGRALRSLIKGAQAALDRGQSIAIFPEGTRVAPGAHRPYHPGVAALYLHLKCPVVPVALNSGLFWGRRSFIKRPGRITVEILPPIEPGLERAAFMAELERRLEGATLRLVEEGRQAQAAPS